MEHKSPTVAIIGGGLAGLTLAICLKKRGIDCTVYELRPASFQLGNAISLSANALRVLDHIGVYKRLLPRGFNFEQIVLANSRGHHIGYFSNGNKQYYDYPAMRMMRRDLRGELLKELELQNIPILYEKKLIKIQEGAEDAEGVTLIFADGETTRASFVVGADGVHSVVREYAYPNIRSTYNGQVNIYSYVKRDVIETKLRRPLDLPPSIFFFGVEGSWCIQPIDHAGDDVAFWANVELSERSQEEWDKLAVDQEQLKQLLIKNYGHKPWLALLKTLCEEAPLENFRNWVITDMPMLEKWLSPSKKIILIGDAAHAMPPHGGQGCAMSFEDAESLACVLAQGEMKPAIRLLETWEAQRVERVKKIIAFNMLAYNLRKASSNRVLQVMKEWFMWLLMKVKGPQGYKWIYSFDAEASMRDLN